MLFLFNFSCSMLFQSVSQTEEKLSCPSWEPSKRWNLTFNTTLLQLTALCCYVRKYVSIFIESAPRPILNRMDLRLLVKEHRTEMKKMRTHFLSRFWNYIGFWKYLGCGVYRLVPQDKNVCFINPAYCA